MVAVIVSVVVPAGVAAVLARVAVPSPLSTNVTPVGSVPVSVSAAVGVPVVVTVNVSALPVANDLAAALVITGAWGATVRVKVWVALGVTPLGR